MKLGTALLIAKDAIEYLEFNKILLEDGSFTDPGVLGDAKFVAVVEASAKAHGVAIKAEIDRVITALPGIIAILGI